MNKLPSEMRVRILHQLCEGMSIRAVTRTCGVSKNTVAKLLDDAGRICAAYHEENVRNVQAKRVQVDEIWSFTYAKQKNVPAAKQAPEGAGDTWTWTAIDADSKLVLSWLVGGRDSEYAAAFMNDVASRLANRIQLTSDGHRPYLEAVEGAFGSDIDFAVLQKIYGTPVDGQKRYSPPECIGVKLTHYRRDAAHEGVTRARHSITKQEGERIKSLIFLVGATGIEPVTPPV